jgi:hypothetical protein
MSGWRKIKQKILELDTFYHLEYLLLYVWILLNATYQGGVQVGCVVLEKGSISSRSGRICCFKVGRRLTSIRSLRLIGWNRRSLSIGVSIRLNR